MPKPHVVLVGVVLMVGSSACNPSDDDAASGGGGAQTGGAGGSGATGGTGGSGGGASGSGGSASGTVAEIAVGKSHNCVRYEDGHIACWGLNGSAELGGGSTDVGTWGVPVVATAIDSTIGIGVGWSTTCGIQAGGTLWCWGKNQDGELGNGTTSSYTAEAVQVSGLTGVTAADGGGSRTCALLSGGEVRCWGDNVFRQLGDGTTNDSPTPVAPLGLSGVEEIGVSRYLHHSCARSGGGVKCWGYNSSGQTGNLATTGFADAPVPMDGLDDAVSIGLGDDHTCAVRAGGSVVCVGGAPLGDATDQNSKTFVTVSGMTTAVQVTGGESFACARLKDQTVTCWGRNSKGQLGDGTTDDALTPVAVAGLSNVVDIGAGGTHVCALTSEPSVYCWGNNEFGQVGAGAKSIPIPQLVTGL